MLNKITNKLQMLWLFFLIIEQHTRHIFINDYMSI